VRIRRHRCDIVTEVFQKAQNIGESYAPLDRYIPYPPEYVLLLI